MVGFRVEGVRRGVGLDLYTTLKAGGGAELFYQAESVDELAAAAVYAFENEMKQTVLGWGSNILPSDSGVKGLVVWNTAREIIVGESGEVVADAGCGFQDLFLKAAQSGLTGFEFAVGIPGTLGGALVSNAGAYRNNVSAFLTEIEVVRDGVREWLSPEFMEFSYRDSLLRKVDPPQITLLRVKFQLARGDMKSIFDEAREFQRQRIGKQPPSASAGSFFKNVNDVGLAGSLDSLPDGLKQAGVVPAGYLIEKVGLKGTRFGGAMIGVRHANFLLNVGGASASEIRRLAEFAAQRVFDEFGVWLEEECLYLGDWSEWVKTGALG